MIYSYDAADRAERAREKMKTRHALANAKCAQRLLLAELRHAVEVFGEATDDVEGAALDIASIASRAIDVGRGVDNAACDLRTLEAR